MTAPDPARGGGVLVGRVLGVPVLVSPSWLLFGAFVMLSYGPTLAARDGPTRGYAAAAGYALLLLASVLLHEIGHCVVARAFDLPVRRITITFLAGLTEITEPPQTPAREYAVAVVGPMVSLLLAGVGAGVAPLLEPDSLPHVLAVGTAATNGIVAAFNLLPGLPLDGGRVLRALIWRFTRDGERATVLAARAGRVVAVLVVPLVVLVLLPAIGFGAPSASSVVLAALVAAFVYAGANGALQRAQVVQRLPDATVGRLARPALTVAADLPLAEAIRRAQAAQLHAVLVVDADGRPVAIASEAAVTSTPEHRRPWVPVSSVSRTVESGLVLAPDLGGEALLAALRATPATEYLVAGPEPAVLSTSDVLQSVAQRPHAPTPPR